MKRIQGLSRRSRGRVIRQVRITLLLSLGLVACDVGYPSASWTDQAYDHAALSGGFLLLGTHTDAPCTACHAPSNYEPLFQAEDGGDCIACHQEDYLAQHAALAFPTACALCHSPWIWGDATFQHQEASGGFDLTGIHKAIPCTGCHDPETFASLFQAADAGDCRVCHGGAVPSWHSLQGFPGTCLLCHTPTAWAQGSFDHLSVSGSFPLLGIHLSLPCTFCHAAVTFEPFVQPGGSGDCVACHASLFEAVHGGQGYPTDCAACHTPTSWKDGEFNHAGISGGFELLGIHAGMSCTACHEEETMAPLFDPEGAQDCVVCHLGDWEGQHQAEAYPQECALCHMPLAWEREGLDHEVASGGFELLGTHVDSPCSACHDPVSFGLLFSVSDETDCAACHMEAFPVAHVSMAYPTDCYVCHTPTQWAEGDFQHGIASGGFDLLGVHDEKPCTVCHHGGTFAPLFAPADENDCLTCHLPEYTVQHGEDGYPTTCLSCHTPTVWTDATFDHDGEFFPIFTGKHSTRWDSCATCHTEPTDFSVFTCFACHKETSTGRRHEGEDDYVYLSSACLTCHPNGAVDD